MPKTPHPAKAAGCTPKQIEAFEQIAVGNSSGVHPRTINALIDKGLIEVTNPGCGRCVSPMYGVPIAIHAQWCKWCDENISDEELAEAEKEAESV